MMVASVSEPIVALPTMVTSVFTVMVASSDAPVPVLMTEKSKLSPAAAFGNYARRRVPVGSW
jgi:hypothetical protein